MLSCVILYCWYIIMSCCIAPIFVCGTNYDTKRLIDTWLFEQRKITKGWEDYNIPVKSNSCYQMLCILCKLCNKRVFYILLVYALNLDSKELCSEIPHDTIPISSMQRNYVFIHKDFVNSPPSPLNLKSFQYHITVLPQWKYILINNYNEYDTNSSLATTIQMKRNLIIASDGSKTKTVSGKVWLIVDMLGQVLISGINLDFEHIDQIHSHWAEIYGVLSVFIFIQEYSKYYMIPF